MCTVCGAVSEETVVCVRVCACVCVCMSLSTQSWIQDKVKDITVPTYRACLHVASYWSFGAVSEYVVLMLLFHIIRV